MEVAINSQELGGYLKNWTAPELLGNWPKVNTIKVFNLPICELDIPDSTNPNVDVSFIFGKYLASFIDKITVFDLQRYWPVRFSAGCVWE